MKFSLKTDSVLKARSKALSLAKKYQQLFKWVRFQTGMGKMTEKEIRDVVDCFVDLAGDSDLWEESPPENSKSLTPEILRDKILKAKDVALDYEHAADTGDFSEMTKVKGMVDHLLDHIVENPPVKGSPEYKMLCQKAAEAMRDRWDSYRKHHIERLAGVTIAVSDGVLVPQQTEPVDEGPLLSTVIEEYISYRDSLPEDDTEKWTPKLRKGHVSALDLFAEYNDDGKIPINRIKTPNCYEFQDMLRRFPSRRKGTNAFKNKTIPQLMETDIQDTLHGQTINNYLSRVKVFFAYAVKRGHYGSPNPVVGIHIKDSRSPDEKRDNFTNEELKALFHSTEYVEDTFTEPFQFWTPLIALFQGMRQKELSQLYLDDIQPVDGVWVFRVIKNTTEKDKTVKTDSSRRLVPIHPFLLKELKFLNYVEHLRGKGGKRLFPELPFSEEGYGRKVGIWFNVTYKVACGIKPPPDGALKDFHSFRGNFISLAAEKNVPIEKRRAVTGHTGKRTDSKVYVVLPVKQLLDEVVAKIDFHKTLKLTPLKKCRFAQY